MKILVKYLDSTNRPQQKFCKTKDNDIFNLMGKEYLVPSKNVEMTFRGKFFPKYYPTVDVTKFDDSEYDAMQKQIWAFKFIKEFNNPNKKRSAGDYFAQIICAARNTLLFFVTLPFFPIILIIKAIRGELDD